MSKTLLKYWSILKLKKGYGCFAPTIEIKLIFLILVVSVTNLYSQSTNLKTEKVFEWIDKDSIFVLQLIVDTDDKFELFGSTISYCFYKYLFYGRGKVTSLKSETLFSFDRISKKEPYVIIDSFSNDDKFIDMRFDVFDQKSTKLDSVVLKWGLQKTFRRKTKSKSFKKKFNQTVDIKFKSGRDINYIKIEKEGKYLASIKLIEKPKKDYRFKVYLTSKPPVMSEYYLNGEEISLKWNSDSEIFLEGNNFLQDKIVLKRINP